MKIAACCATDQYDLLVINLAQSQLNSQPTNYDVTSSQWQKIFNFHWQLCRLLYSATASAMTHGCPQLSVRVWLLKTFMFPKTIAIFCRYRNASLICRNPHATNVLTEVQTSNRLGLEPWNRTGPRRHSSFSTSLAIAPLSIRVPQALHEPVQPHRWHRSEEGSSNCLTSTMEERVIQTCHEFVLEICMAVKGKGTFAFLILW
jgi:hypothetical protein